MTLIDNFIRDLTKVTPMSKSEMKERLKEVLESVVPEEKYYEDEEPEYNNAVNDGWFLCRQEILDRINSLNG